MFVFKRFTCKLYLDVEHDIKICMTFHHFKIYSRWGGIGFHMQWDMALFCWTGWKLWIERLMCLDDDLGCDLSESDQKYQFEA